MKFTVDNAIPAAPRAQLTKVANILRALPDGSMITRRGLSTKSGYSEVYLGTFAAMIPSELSFKQGNKKLYGNPKTIAAWKKQNLQH